MQFILYDHLKATKESIHPRPPLKDLTKYREGVHLVFEMDTLGIF